VSAALAGLLKRYGLDVNTSDILQANLDSASLPVSVVAEAAELNKWVSIMQESPCGQSLHPHNDPS